MSSSIVRVGNGGTIQVRTGVVAGIGPTGPTGPTGNRGIQGERGVQGSRGDTGYVSEAATISRRSAAQPLAVTTNTLLQFDAVDIDELSAVSSLSNFVPGVGTYYVTAWAKTVRGSGGATNSRVLSILQNGVVVAANQGHARGGTNTDVDISVQAGIRITNPSDIISFQLWQNDTVSIQITAARIFLTRTGPGPKGDKGTTGDQGPVGPVGPQGIQGLTGTNFPRNTTFDDIDQQTV